jgi:uncharacterized surface protein with fasciclin (FAS1) repeats
MKFMLPIIMLLAIAGGVRSETEPETLLDIVLDINKKTGEFSTLIAAVVELDLTGALDGEDPLTVFAPGDAAFAKLGLDADNIGDVPEKLLEEIILYHITGGKKLAADLLPNSSKRGWAWFFANRIEMLNGGTAFITNGRKGPAINRARIVKADVEADNGAIHVINRVLLPIARFQRG